MDAPTRRRSARELMGVVQVLPECFRRAAWAVHAGKKGNAQGRWFWALAGLVGRPGLVEGLAIGMCSRPVQCAWTAQEREGVGAAKGELGSCQRWWLGSAAMVGVVHQGCCG